MSDTSELEQAKKLFRSFHGRDPKTSELAEIPLPGKGVIGLEVGKCVGIAYRAAGNGEVYYHEFPAATRPRLFVTPAGEQAYLIGGTYKFTNRGFLR